MTMYDVRRFIRNKLTNAPSMYRLYAQSTGKFLVTPDIDIVIEGFPRSANSYLEAYFQVLTANQIKMAHHSHSRTEVFRAVRLKLPVVVLLRNPVDAIVSFMEESQGKLSSPYVLLDEYCTFYKGMQKISCDVIFCSFETAITAPEKVVTEVEKKYGVKFPRCDAGVSEQDVSDVLLEHAAERMSIVPAYKRERSVQEEEERRRNRENYRAKVMRVEVGSMLAKAEALYAEFIGKCI